MNPLVSIVVTSYNSSNSITRCINSILSQSYGNYEIFICDDFSKDNTVEIAEALLTGNNFRYEILLNDKNWGGPARGRNAGIKKSKGKYICFFDADDEWLPEKLKVQVEFLENSIYDFCGTQVNVIGSEPFRPVFGDINYYSELFRNKFALSSLMTKVSCFKVNELLFDERKIYFGVEDYELILRFYNLGLRGFVIKSKQVNYYYNLTSLSHNNLKENEQKRILVLKNLVDKSLAVILCKRIIINLLKIKYKL